MLNPELPGEVEIGRVRCEKVVVEDLEVLAVDVGDAGETAGFRVAFKDDRSFARDGKPVCRRQPRETGPYDGDPGRSAQNMTFST